MLCHNRLVTLFDVTANRIFTQYACILTLGTTSYYVLKYVSIQNKLRIVF